jgi:3-oxoacyl-[acyl-carrier-protein] synthase-3
MSSTVTSNLGIAAIALYEPPWVLANDWFGGTIPRKFVQHTGIEARPISVEDEVTMAVRVAKAIQRETACDFRKCAGLYFVSPSFIPLSVAKKHLDEQAARAEGLQHAARQFAKRLGAPSCNAVGINWFCSGYSKALSLACRRARRGPPLDRDQYLLIVTASRISRITDYSCTQTGPLFGDMATATLLATSDSPRFPVHFDLLHAHAEKQSADGVFFNFHLRQNVPSPTTDGGKATGASPRLVFSLDGMGIADAAPRAMSSALAKALAATGLRPDELRYVVPHQAGTAIVRLTTMKLEQLGVQAEVVNGLTKSVGNVSSGSIPYALKKSWDRLHGIIACPTAAVGDPGRAKVSQGCLLLKSTYHHARLAQAAA